MDREQLRAVIFKEIMEFHQPRTPTLSFQAFLRPVPKVDGEGEGGEEGEGAEEGEQVESGDGPSFKQQLQAMMASAASTSSSTSSSAAATVSVDKTAGKWLSAMRNNIVHL
jgi:hypothetical protein